MSNRRKFIKEVGVAAGAALLPTQASEAQSEPPIDYDETISGTITGSDPTDSKWPDYHTDPYSFEGTEDDGIGQGLEPDTGVRDEF